MAGSSLVSKPDVTLAIEGAGKPVSNEPQRVLIVAAMFSTGSATPGALTENIPQDAASIDGLFGARSQIALACRNFRKVNESTPVDAIGLTETGAAATGAFLVAGAATESGSITFVVGSAIDAAYDVVVADLDTADAIADSIVAAINSDTRRVASATNAGSGVVTMTARQPGLHGNGIMLQVIDGTLISGTTATVSIAMNSGSGDPISAGVFDVVADQRYQTVIYPSESDTSILKSFLDPRFNAENDILDGVGVITLYDTFSNILAVNNAHNSQSLVTLNFPVTAEDDYRGIAMSENPIGISAQLGAARSLRLTAGALISDLLVGQLGFDAKGGTALATRPYFNTPFPNLPIIILGRGWSSVEVQQIGLAGGSTIGSNLTRTGVIAGEMFTTYKTDAAANPDDSFNFLNKVDAAVNAREYFFNNIKKEYAQMRLTSGSLVPGRPMTNETQIRGFLMSLYRDLSETAFVLTVAGPEAETVFADNLIVEIDFSAGAVDVVFNRVPLVSQFREFFGTFKIAFEA